jgi:hypothetical protein
MPEQIKCAECDNMILPQTAIDNEGLCGQCVKLPPEVREELKQFRAQLADGSYFYPSNSELASATIPDALATGRNWQLQPDYYADRDEKSPIDAINQASSKMQGNIFLVADDGDELSVGFSQDYAVCEYHNNAAGEWRIAYSDQNLTKQVADSLHVVQSCPCCGVGLQWYPSRYHMPRTLAFEIMRDSIHLQLTPNIQWLETDDFCNTSSGRG